MKILAVDTATRSCSVAIVEGGRLQAELTLSTGETHARHLMTMIDTAFNLSNTAMADIGGFAVTTGPGTFTGLRIGLSTVKGMALAASKPVVGISSLDVLAAQAASSPRAPGHLICAMLDARRKEIYFCLYRTGTQVAEPVSEPRVALPESLADMIGEPCLMVGNGALLYRELLEEKLGKNIVFAGCSINTIRAETVAQLARTKFVNHTADVSGSLQPLYIRKSDAEVNASKSGSPAV